MLARRRSALICLANSLLVPAAALPSAAGDQPRDSKRVAALVGERIPSGSDDRGMLRDVEQRGASAAMRWPHRSPTTASGSRGMRRHDWQHPQRAPLTTGVRSTRDHEWIDGAIIVGTLAAVPLLALWVVARTRRRSARPPTRGTSRRHHLRQR